MKVIIFEPHPDDLLFGAGYVIFDWLKEKQHDIHVITITDGRACYRDSEDILDDIAVKMTEDEVARERINEAKKTIEYVGLPSQNHHILHFHDAEGQKYVKNAIEKVIPIVKGSDRFVLPSNNNKHVDHQATYNIAISAAKELKLKNVQFWIYFLPEYGKFMEDSKDKMIEINITEVLRKKLLEWAEIYDSQKRIKFTWKMYKKRITQTKKINFGIYNFDDIGNYYNF